MIDGDQKYSLIGRALSRRKPSKYAYSLLYEKMFSPASALALSVAFIAASWKLFGYKGGVSFGGDAERVLLILLLALTFLIGLRLMQSCFYAVKDYGEHIVYSVGDVITYFIILLFSSCLVPFVLGIFCSEARELIKWVFFTYGMLSIGGASKYSCTLSILLPGSDTIDYPIERKIQIVNMIVQILFVLLFSLGFALTFSQSQLIYLYGGMSAVVLIAALTVFNMSYSHRMANHPSILITNDVDSARAVINEIREGFSHASWITEARWDELERELEELGRSEVLIETSRIEAAEWADFAEKYVEKFFRNLPAPLEALKSEPGIVDLVGWLLRSGKDGQFLNFYKIVSNGSKVGYFWCSTKRWKEPLVGRHHIPKIAFFLIRRVGVLKSFRLLRELNSHKKAFYAERGSSALFVGDIIVEDGRIEEYSKSLLRLLRVAFLENSSYNSNMNELRYRTNGDDDPLIGVLEQIGCGVEREQSLDGSEYELVWRKSE